jgi:hypothetical protein
MLEEQKKIVNSLSQSWILWLLISSLVSVNAIIYTALSFINILCWVYLCKYLILDRIKSSNKNKLMMLFFMCMKFNLFLVLIGLGVKLFNNSFEQAIGLGSLLIVPFIGGLIYSYKYSKKETYEINTIKI